MSNWRDKILQEFTPNVARLTVVADPDGLLLEEGILEGIHERGFELIPFEDHIAFRYAYESKFRSKWDRGEHTDLVVVLRFQTSDLNKLPYDLLNAGRRLSFNLGDIFPNLSYPVVTVLDRGDLDALCEAQKLYAPGHLGDNATKEFVLRHVFEVAPELVKQPTDLLRVLLRRHYNGQRIPEILDNRFLQLLRQNTAFNDWPLETILSDREAFFMFLQERWLIFLDQEAAKGTSRISEDQKPYGFTIKGPVYLPFEHHDIRVYIDNLFTEGLLHPVSHERSDVLSKTWMGVGIQTTPLEDRFQRLTRLIGTLKESIPGDDAKYTDWFHFAHGWAEAILLTYEQTNNDPNEIYEQVRSLQTKVDQNFTAWLFKRYAGLANLPPVPPVMLHHIPRFLARKVVEDHNSKVALIVVDGLAIDQWMVIRNVLRSRKTDLLFREQLVFAWVPSLTSVSRQAAFAGRAPIFFPESIYTTEKEPALWSQFWVDQGFKANQAVYMKGLGDGTIEHVIEALSHPKIRVAGFVIDKVDKIMHGMEMGTAGMHNQVGQWAKLPYLETLLKLLLDKGFCVYLTSDHGNIEAEGCGRPLEGSIAELRGERVRVYSDSILRNKVKEQYPAAIEWSPIGVPDNYMALLAPSRQAFIPEKQRAVSHGGISIEEIIVPLVQIERRT